MEEAEELTFRNVVLENKNALLRISENPRLYTKHFSDGFRKRLRRLGVIQIVYSDEYREGRIAQLTPEAMKILGDEENEP